MRLASDELLSLVWTQTWQIAVVTIAVAVLVRLTCCRRPHLAYLLWMLVIVKAITPPVWSSPTGAFSWARAETIAAPTTAAPTSVAREISGHSFDRPQLPEFAATEPRAAEVSANSPTAIQSTPLPPEPPLPFTAGTWILLSWLVGSLAIVTLVFVRWMRLLAQLRRTSQPVDESLQRQFDELRSRLGLRRSVRLVVTSDNLGPAAFGWWRGKVLLPQAVAEQSQPSELAAIVAHELVHVRRFDPLIGSLQLAVQCLWWFHPAVWWANRQIRLERERACDEEVLAELRCPPSDYARLLVRILSWRQQFVPAVFWSGMRSWDVTSERLRHVLETTAFHRRAPVWTWLVAAVALLIILPGAGRTIVTASPPDEQSTAAAPADSAQPPEAPAASTPKVGEEMSAKLEAMQQIGKRGLRWGHARAFGFGEVKEQQMLTLPSSFDPGDTPLPLAPLAHVLTEVTVGQYFEPPIATEKLRAQIRSLRELPASAKLVVNFAKENAAGLDALVDIPNLSQLSLQCSTDGFSIDWSDTASRPFRLSDLKAIKALRLWASDADLPEIAAINTLESLTLSGDISPDAIDRFAAPGPLKKLSLYGYHKDPPRAIDLKCLAGIPGLEELGLGGDFVPSDVGASQIGALSKLRELSLRVDQLSDAGIASIARAGELRLLVLEAGQSSPRLTAAGFAALGSLTKLDSLMFSGKELKTSLLLTDESVAGWNRLTGLRMLIIDSCSIGDAGIRNFASLPILYCLQLEGPLQVTDAGVAELRKAPELAAIVLNGSKITGPGLAALNASPNLWLLNLTDSPLTDAGLEALASCKRLAQLDVSGSKISDRGLAALRGRLPQLTRLNLARTEITDGGLGGFSDRSDLQEINLIGTKLSGGAIEKLLDARQELKIWSTDADKPQTRGEKRDGPFEPIDLTQVIFAPPPDARVPAALDAKADQAATAKAANPVATTGAAANAPSGAAAPKLPEAADAESATAIPSAISLKVADAVSSTTDAMYPLSEEERVAFKEIESRGIKLQGQWYGASGQPWKKENFTLTATLSRSSIPRGVGSEVSSPQPLPLDRLPQLLHVNVGDPMERSPSTAPELRSQLLLLRKLLPKTTLTILVTADNAAGLDALAEIPQLEHLARSFFVLPGVKQDPQAVASKVRFDKLKNLRSLSWWDASAENLSQIAQLPRLENLALTGDFSEPALDALSSLHQLKSLQLSRYGVEQPVQLALNCLEGMPGLTRLTVTGPARIDDAAAGRIGGLKELRWAQLNCRGLSNTGLQSLNRAAQLSTLMLEGFSAEGMVTSAGLAALGGLTNLESMYLMGYEAIAATPLEITDASVAGWEGLQKLNRLVLQPVRMGDAGLRSLGDLRSLKNLQLVGTLDVTDAGLAPLEQLSQLEGLVLVGSRISGAGLKALTGLKQLALLSLAGAPVDDSGAAHLAELSALSALDLSGATITDAGLERVARLPKLQRLNIAETKTSDAGIMRLADVQNLQELNAAATQFTAAGMAKLLAGKPNLRIWLGPGNDSIAAPGSMWQSVEGPFTPIAVEHFAQLAPPAASAGETKSAAISGKATPPTDELISRLHKLGLRVVRAGEGAELPFFADFEKSFKPLDEPLPLDALPGLKSIAINDRLDLSEAELIARLKAVRKLQPETTLLVFFTPEQGAAFNLLAEIPGLRKLGIMSELPTVGRTLELGDLTQLQQLTLVDDLTDEKLAALTPLVELEELQLYQSKPYAKLDFAFLENKPKLKRIMTGGIRPTDAAFARVGELAALEYLAIDVAEATDAGLAPLANLVKLETLTLGSSGAKSRVTPAGLRTIGKLSNLKNLTFSGEFSPSADTKVALSDQIVADWPEQLKNLMLLQLFDCEVGDAGMESLSQLPALNRLRLNGKVRVSDRGRRALGTMTRLRYLALADPGMNDAELAHLRNLTNLESLTLGECKLVSDAGLSALAEFTKLKKLSIRDASLQGAGFAALAKLGQLESLSVADNPIDDAGVAKIVGLKSLRELDLRRTKITDEALTLIGRDLPELTKLNISGTNVTDAGLAALQPLKQLREVEANATKVTDAKHAGLSAIVTSGSNMWTGEMEFLSLEMD